MSFKEAAPFEVLTTTMPPSNASFPSSTQVSYSPRPLVLQSYSTAMHTRIVVVKVLRHPNQHWGTICSSRMETTHPASTFVSRFQQFLRLQRAPWPMYSTVSSTVSCSSVGLVHQVRLAIARIISSEQLLAAGAGHWPSRLRLRGRFTFSPCSAFPFSCLSPFVFAPFCLRPFQFSSCLHHRVPHSIPSSRA